MSTELELVYTWSNLGTDLHEKQDTASLQCSLEFSNDDMDVQTFLHNYDRIPMPLQRISYALLGSIQAWQYLYSWDIRWQVGVCWRARLLHGVCTACTTGQWYGRVAFAVRATDSCVEWLLAATSTRIIHAVAMNHVLFSSPHTFSMRSIAYGMPSGEVQVWNVAREVPQRTIVIPNEEETTPVTAVAWSQMFHNGDNNTMPEDFNSFLAVGKSSGRVFLYDFNWNAMEYQSIGVLPPRNTDAIHSLQWIHGMNENDHLFLFTDRPDYCACTISTNFVQISPLTTCGTFALRSVPLHAHHTILTHLPAHKMDSCICAIQRQGQ